MSNIYFTQKKNTAEIYTSCVTETPIQPVLQLPLPSVLNTKEKIFVIFDNNRR